MHVEEKQQCEDSIIGEYEKGARRFVVVVGNGNQVTLGPVRGPVSQRMEDQKKPLFDLLAQMRRELEADASIKGSERQDLLADIETVKRQLKKREPNRTVLAALLEPLSQISSIAGAVANLITLINA